MSVCFLTEMGPKIGYGHMTRCLALSQAFEEKGMDVSFVVHSDENFKKIPGVNHIEQCTWFKKDIIRSVLKGQQIIIIDSYIASEDIYKIAADNAEVLLSFDDYNRINYPGGIVLNASADAEKMNYPQNNAVEYFIGEKYVPIRKPFWDLSKRIVNPEISNLLIMFGGTDAQNLTGKVVQSLSRAYPGVNKSVVIHSKNVEKISSLNADNTEYFHDCSAEQIKELMMKADLAISAGGQSLYEFAATGLPAVSVAVADNQRGNTAGWQEKGLIKFAGFWEDKRLLDNIVGSVSAVQKAEIRQQMTDSGQKYVDGQGARRVTNVLIERQKAKYI